MPWSQNYAPLGGVGASALVAALPVVVLLSLLAVWHVRAQLASLAGLIVAFGVAVMVFHMPLRLAAAAAVYGGAFGLFPIGWILVNAIFIFHLTVETGQFAVLQGQVSGVSGDRRIQALLIAFCFGAFIEGAAGFGAPVAISGALLIGLGFRPLEAAKLTLIGNTAPVAFGALGTPLITLAKMTDLGLLPLSGMVGRQLPFFSLLIPFWLVVAQAGWRGMLEVWPACLAAGGSFALSQFLLSNYHGPWLVDIVSALVSMAALLLLTRFWRPPAADEPAGGRAAAGADTPPARSAFRAWVPWLCLTGFVFLWGLPPIKATLNGWFSPAVSVPWLDQAVVKAPPVVAKPEAERAVFSFNLLSATGSALLLAGLTAGLCLGLSLRRLGWLYLHTLWQLRVSLLTIVIMLALGFTTRYSGSDCAMGLAFAGAGRWFPLFSPIIGWLGVALTGSDTSSNVLFGNLQKVTAEQLHLPPLLMAAANSSGGVMGKMIDAQSIVVASVATGGRPDSPGAGTVLRAVFWHSIALALLVGVLVAGQAWWASTVGR